MHRKDALEALKLYQESQKLSAEDQAIYNRIVEFIKSTPDCFSRENLIGHVTGSAMIVNPKLDRVLLTLHKKLGKWLQLGGHCDGDPQVDRVALREAEEESGLIGLEFIMVIPGQKVIPFDLDFHEIPARAGEPKHIHYDICYLIVADEDDALVVSDESSDLKWFSLDEAYALCPERSMQRQFEKIEILRTSISIS